MEHVIIKETTATHPAKHPKPPTVCAQLFGIQLYPEVSHSDSAAFSLTVIVAVSKVLKTFCLMH